MVVDDVEGAASLENPPGNRRPFGKVSRNLLGEPIFLGRQEVLGPVSRVVIYGHEPASGFQGRSDGLAHLEEFLPRRSIVEQVGGHYKVETAAAAQLPGVLNLV